MPGTPASGTPASGTPGPGTPEAGTPTCATCGRRAEDDDAAALARTTWTRGSENGRTVWTCDACSRTHLRSIEGKLDSAWW